MLQSPPLSKAKPRFRSEDASDASDQVYLKSTWVVSTLRHPSLRLLNCVLHLLCCFVLSVTSPLLTSLQTPARFPVYGDLLKTVTAGFTWQKLLFQSVVCGVLPVFLRLMAYPRLVQHQWNWRQAHHHATRILSRLSRSPSANNLSVSDDSNPREVIPMHIFSSHVGSASTAVRLQVWNVGFAHGSWTFVAALFPFLWAAIIFMTRKLVRDSALEDNIFPEDRSADSGALGALQQLEVQKAFYVMLITLSCFKLLVTLDEALQEYDCNRALFGNWLSGVRRVYCGFPVVRIVWCWSCIVAFAVGEIYLEGISYLQTQWMAWDLDRAQDTVAAMNYWLLNLSWYAMLSSLVIVLDILWIVQDLEFPSFASPVGSRIFGLHLEQFTLRFPFRLRFTFASKWLGAFVVLAWIIPLELGHFLQVMLYSPHKYEQEINKDTFRVLPMNSTSGDLLNVAGDDTSCRMIETGSLCRYFAWSAWDRIPALFVMLLGVMSLLWLWKKERCKICYAIFLGLCGAQENQARAVAGLNAAVPLATKQVLATQRRLRKLYKLRTRCDSFCTVLAAISVATVWMQFRAIWRSSTKYRLNVALQSPGETYAVLLLLITLLLLHQVHHRYSIKMEIMELRNEISPTSGSNILRAPRYMLLSFLTEVLLCGVLLPPLMHGRVYLNEGRYSLARGSLSVLPACPAPLAMSLTHRSCALQYSYPLEIVNMIVLVRLYWFGRVVRNQLYKLVAVDKVATVGSPILWEKDLPVNSLWWSFRVSFALRPANLLLKLFVFLWLSTAATVSIFERPFPSKLDGEDHSLWLALVTMTGVGYGDVYPITTSGRTAIVIGAVIGGLGFISLMTSEFLDSLKGTKREHAVLNTMEVMRWERSLRKSAQEVIYAAWNRHHNINPRSTPDRRRSSKRSDDRQLLKAAHRFKRCRRQRPKQTAASIRHLQMSELSESFSHDVGTWVESKREETAADLDALEHHMERISDTIQALV